MKSDVITYSRISSTSCRVYVDSQACVEYKILFASGNKRNNNATLDYLDEIKHDHPLADQRNLGTAAHKSYH